MHHVPNPRRMAREMLRVSRKHVFLIEANGLSILRKLAELSPRYMRDGEKSYTPWRYRSFFQSGISEVVQVKPFLFMIPFTPSFLINTNIIFSEFLQKVPILKWQCTGVMIYVQKRH
jgi:hypothetical protein